MTINFNYPLSRQLVMYCQEHQLTLAVAESCSGGSLSEVITSVPGSSEVFDRGFITYSNSSKIECLGVPSSDIERHGAVSEVVAIAMAKGALAHSHADLSISITGISGPTGGTPDKPVGTVWFALAHHHSHTIKTRQLILRSGRKHIRRKATQHALEWLLLGCHQLTET